MKLSYLFVYQAVVALAFGVVALVSPTLLGSTYGAPLDKTAQTLAQYFGGTFITLGLISWFFRNAPASTERLALVRSLAVGAVLGLVVDVLAITGGVVNQLGWLNVGLGLVSAVGFGYHSFGRPSALETTTAR